MTPAKVVSAVGDQTRVAPDEMAAPEAVSPASRVRVPLLTSRVPVPRSTSPLMVQEPEPCLTRDWKLRTAPSRLTLPTRVRVLVPPPPSMMPRTVASGPRLTVSSPAPSWMATSVALAARMLPVLLMVQSASVKVSALVRLMVPALDRLVRLVSVPEKSSVAPEATVMELVARAPVTESVPAAMVVPPL